MADLLPTREDIEVPRAADVTLTFTLTDADGNVIDISNDKVQLRVVDKLGGEEQVALTNDGALGEHSDPTNGETKFELTQAQLSGAAISESTDTKWRYAVRREDATGDEQPHIVGILTIRPDASAPIP